MKDTTLTTLLNKLINIENRIHGMETEFITYVEANPKGDDQWLETRMHAVEESVKKLLKYTNDDRKVLADELDHSKFNECNLESLQNNINDINERLDARPTHDQLDEWLHESKTNYKNHTQAVNERIAKLEQDLKCVDPKYVAMGQELSEANDNMVRLQHDRNAHFVAELSTVKGSVQELKERDTQCRMMIVDLLKEITQLQNLQSPENNND